MEIIELAVMKDPSGLQYDAYQAVCLKLQAKARQVEMPVKVIGVTSATAAEGQEEAAASLAVVMAKTGAKTLLLDCDLRAPVLHEVFHLPNLGLTECLAGAADYHAFVQSVAGTGLDMITSGAAAIHAGELLAGRPMQELLDAVREEYEYIFLNTPPVLASSDALSAASKADGVILVIACGKNEAKVIHKAKVTLEQAGASLLGCILNNTKEI